MIDCDRDIGNTGRGGYRSSNADRLNTSRYKSLSTKTVTNLNIIHTNCQSAMNKRSEVVNLIETQKPDILALTELGASRAVTDGELGIEGYTLYRKNHTDGSGGPGKGVALYVKNSLNHTSSPVMEELEFDCAAWSTIKLAENQSLLVGAVYRSPNSNDENNQKLLSLVRAAVATNDQYLTICGDFNMPKIDWSVSQSLESENCLSSDFVRLVEELGLFQHARSSTRFRGEQNSCLDLVLTNEECMINEIRELPPIGKSDHICQQWKLIVSEVMFRNTSVVRSNFKRARWNDLRNDLRVYNNETQHGPSTMYDEFIHMLNQAKDKHIPKCRPKTNKYRLPWMKSPKIKKQRTAQWAEWRKYKRTGSVTDYDAYKMERNKLCNMIRSAKMQYESRLISDMKHNPNLYHGHCRRTLKTKQGVTNVVNGEGTMTETEQETAEALSSYYDTVFTRDDGKSAPNFPSQTEEKISDVYLSVEAVEEKLRELNPNKASGPDGVEGRILKECAVEIAPILLQIFRKSIDESEVPEQWKVAEIVPIHKGGSKAVMANFRPVALTSVVCKVLERMICSAILAFLATHSLITKQQHGFVRGRSCQTNIMLCLERWTELVDSGKSVDVAYFDYAKAFDKVSHRLLLIKLQAYGIDGKLLAWLAAWLRNRKQRVVVGNAKSSWLPVVSGTTQGTVLGFLLFLIFINDLPAKCAPEDESVIKLLADDTKAFQAIGEEAGEQVRNQEELQSRINNISQWAKDWEMEINPSKSKVMHIGGQNPSLPYYINGIEIATVTTEKDIGFWIRDDLSTSTHVQKARGKALGEICRIRRNFSFIDKKAFCTLYNQRIRPHLDYGMTACPPGTVAEKKLLESVQSKATAMVQGLKHRNAEERRKALGLMTLDQRRERGDLIEVFKILKGHTKIDPALFWEVREARNGARLVKSRAANGRRQRQNFFSYRVIQKWNLLPVGLRKAPSLDSFKTNLDALLLKDQ